MQIRTEKNPGIWLALAVALGLHAIILFLPITRQMPPADDVRTRIELQLTPFRKPPPAPQAAAQMPEIAPPLPVPEPIAEVSKILVETQPEVEPPSLTSSPQARRTKHDWESMSEQEKTRLTNSILMRRFTRQESVTDQLFGKPLERYSSEPQKEFHYPLRQDMIAMLDRPMPELPFAYTPGLIYFAYDPGIKGDLQRFWDVITPEFGWTTDNGTEFRCIWVLVIVGCGWK